MVNVATTNLKLWHERMGHVSKDTLKQMVKNGAVQGMKLTDLKNFFCEACQVGKSHRFSFKPNVNKVDKQPGEYFHLDVIGPFSKESLGGARFFINFKDECSGFRHIYFMKHKSDVPEVFIQFERLIANKFNQSMLSLMRSTFTTHR